MGGLQGKGGDESPFEREVEREPEGLSWGLGEEQVPPWYLLLPRDAQRVGPCLGRGGKAVGEKHQVGEIRVQLLSCALRKVDC